MKHTGEMKSVVPLVGMILLIMMANGLVAVFGVNYHKVMTSRAQDEMERVYEGVERVREVQLHFKRQVQAWKNILLRGHVPADYATYAEAFRKEQRMTLDLLASLAADWRQWSEIAQRGVALADQLAVLNSRYAEALARLDAGASVQAVDLQVRGLDRPLESELDSIVQRVDDQVRLRRQALRHDDLARYQQFRRLFSLSTAAGCILTLVMLVVLLRRQAGA
ncbi:MAG TPA: hypothetical protein DCS43_16380 [Verrucomicrobia bacterium]|nr:hypothetical protein [Verrucomicrobiota bacterium]